jgi:hypothetical protein
MHIVTRCLCPATVLTKERIRKFATKAQAYICTYYFLEQENNSSDDIGDILAAKQLLLHKKIEQLMKRFKAHCCALDFDMHSVLAVLKGQDDNENAG